MLKDMGVFDGVIPLYVLDTKLYCADIFLFMVNKNNLQKIYDFEQFLVSN